MADSWEWIEDDCMKDACAYLGGTGRCCECEHDSDDLECWQKKDLDLVARAKRMAGVE